MKKIFVTIFAFALSVLPGQFVFAQAGGGAVLNDAEVIFGMSDGQYSAHIFGGVTLPQGLTTGDIVVAVAVLDEPITDLAGYYGSYHELFDENDFAPGGTFSRYVPDANGTPFIPDEDYFFIFRLASLAEPDAFPPVYSAVTRVATGAPAVQADDTDNSNNDPGGNNPNGLSGLNPFTYHSIDNPLCEGSDTPNCQEFDVMLFLQRLFSNMVKIALPFLVLFMIYSGFLFVEAQGNEKKLEDAKKNFKYVIIGAALIFASWTIAMAIKGTVEDLEEPISFLSNINNFL